MSFLNFKGCKITVVTTATDLRAGYFRLEAFARSTLNIDICSGNHCVVFLSRTRALAKISPSLENIHHSHGNLTLQRQPGTHCLYPAGKHWP